MTEKSRAADVFDKFCNASTFKTILGHYRHLCGILKLRPAQFPVFYPKLKAKLGSWKAEAIWSKLEKRASHKCYDKGKICGHLRVLIIGCGPCGLRTAIEAQLLGAKVVVVEKRDRFSRNNVLHLWPFVIHDLRALGAKKFFGKFCAGSIDHISIRQLQCILLKVALILGVEVHEGVGFEDIIEPPEDQSKERIGWRASVIPHDHPVHQYEFDCLVGADGKRNTLKSFKRKEFRGKLAIAITANFINKHTQAEARVPEISGVAFIFHQKFFRDMNEATGIDLENIVYYKDDTHYFVMTAKKHSLLSKGVILYDYPDTAKLLAPENVNKEALMRYAREAADFSTDYQLPHLDFAVNHYGQPDVAMFDFTSMFAAEYSCRIIERRGHKLLMQLVGDSLLEPFWPTGSGCARGFLSSMDACWMLRSLGCGRYSELQCLAERESIYRLLAQTTPENLNKDYNAMTLDPHTRYRNLHTQSVSPFQVRYLFDTDCKETVSDFISEEILVKRRKKDVLVHPETLLSWLSQQVQGYGIGITDMTTSFKSGVALCAIIHRYRPELINWSALHVEDVAHNNQLAFSIAERELGIPPVMTGEEMATRDTPDLLTMLAYLSQIYECFKGQIPYTLKDSNEVEEMMDTIEPVSPKRVPPALLNRLNQPQPLPTRKRTSLDARTRKRRSAPQNKERGARSNAKLRLDSAGTKPFSEKVQELENKLSGKDNRTATTKRHVGRLTSEEWNVQRLEKKKAENEEPCKKVQIDKPPKWSKDMFQDKYQKMKKIEEGKSDEPEKFIGIDTKLKQLERKLREGSNLEIGTRGSNKVSAMAKQLKTKLVKQEDEVQKVIATTKPAVLPMIPTSGDSKVCHFCQKRVYLMERLSAEGKFFHRGCFRCWYCGTLLRLGNYSYDRTSGSGRFYCAQHFSYILAGIKPTKRRLDEVDDAYPPLPVQMEAPNHGVLLRPDLERRGTTPERVEFENTVILSSEDDVLTEIDEDEFTDRNFGTSTVELASSDDDISDITTDSESDEEEYSDALERPLTSAETRQLAESWRRIYTSQSDTDSNSRSSPVNYSDLEYEFTEGDETETADEEELNEAEIRAREQRKFEVALKPPPTQSLSSDTEVASDDSDYTDSEEEGEEEESESSTEIDTDSEFDRSPVQDKPIPTIVIHESEEQKATDDVLSKVPSKVYSNSCDKKDQPSASKVSQIGIAKPSPLYRIQSAINDRSASEENIAQKMSLELKKKYLLGEANSGGIASKPKTQNTSLENRFKSLMDTISSSQSLLKPAATPSPTMQAFMQSNLVGYQKPKVVLSGAKVDESKQKEVHIVDKTNEKNVEKNPAQNKEIPSKTERIEDVGEPDIPAKSEEDNNRSDTHQDNKNSYEKEDGAIDNKGIYTKQLIELEEDQKSQSEKEDAESTKEQDVEPLKHEIKKDVVKEDNIDVTIKHKDKECVEEEGNHVAKSGEQDNHQDVETKAEIEKVKQKTEKDAVIQEHNDVESKEEGESEDADSNSEVEEDVQSIAEVKEEKQDVESRREFENQKESTDLQVTKIDQQPLENKDEQRSSNTGSIEHKEGNEVRIIVPVMSPNVEDKHASFSESESSTSSEEQPREKVDIPVVQVHDEAGKQIEAVDTKEQAQQESGYSVGKEGKPEDGKATVLKVAYDEDDQVISKEAEETSIGKKDGDSECEVETSLKARGGSSTSTSVHSGPEMGESDWAENDNISIGEDLDFDHKIDPTYITFRKKKPPKKSGMLYEDNEFISSESMSKAASQNQVKPFSLELDSIEFMDNTEAATSSMDEEDIKKQGYFKLMDGDYACVETVNPEYNKAEEERSEEESSDSDHSTLENISSLTDQIISCQTSDSIKDALLNDSSTPTDKQVSTPSDLEKIEPLSLQEEQAPETESFEVIEPVNVILTSADTLLKENEDLLNKIRTRQESEEVEEAEEAAPKTPVEQEVPVDDVDRQLEQGNSTEVEENASSELPESSELSKTPLIPSNESMVPMSEDDTDTLITDGSKSPPMFRQVDDETFFRFPHLERSQTTTHVNTALIGAARLNKQAPFGLMRDSIDVRKSTYARPSYSHENALMRSQSCGTMSPEIEKALARKYSQDRQRQGNIVKDLVMSKVRSPSRRERRSSRDSISPDSGSRKGSRDSILSPKSSQEDLLDLKPNESDAIRQARLVVLAEENKSSDDSDLSQEEGDDFRVSKPDIRCHDEILSASEELSKREKLITKKAPPAEPPPGRTTGYPLQRPLSTPAVPKYLSSFGSDFSEHPSPLGSVTRNFHSLTRSPSDVDPRLKDAIKKAVVSDEEDQGKMRRWMETAMQAQPPQGFVAIRKVSAPARSTDINQEKRLSTLEQLNNLNIFTNISPSSSAPPSSSVSPEPGAGKVTTPSVSPDTLNKQRRSKMKDRTRRRSIIEAISGIFAKNKKDKPTSPTPTGRQEEKEVAPKPKERLPKLKFRKNSKDKLLDGVNAKVEAEAELERRNSGVALCIDTTVSPGPEKLPSLSLSPAEYKKPSSSTSRASRQAELARLRQAQEIQRHLEEVEIQQRELEQRGVVIERALRSERCQEEGDLLSEWFKLVHEKQRLSRIEQELLVQTKQLQLEDRHSKLQQQLRQRIQQQDKDKSADSIAVEGEILAEMLEIVEQRDTLVATLEEDHERCAPSCSLLHRPLSPPPSSAYPLLVLAVCLSFLLAFKTFAPDFFTNRL